MIQFNQQRKIAFIVDCDKVVIPTPYWVAEELLANGRGVLVSYINTRRIARVVMESVGNDSLLNQVMQRAYNYGRAMTWPKTGRAYWNIFMAFCTPQSVLSFPCERWQKLLTVHYKRWQMLQINPAVLKLLVYDRLQQNELYQ